MKKIMILASLTYSLLAFSAPTRDNYCAKKSADQKLAMTLLLNRDNFYAQFSAHINSLKHDSKPWTDDSHYYVLNRYILCIKKSF